jgi:two-component system response regulator AgrA
MTTKLIYQKDPAYAEILRNQIKSTFLKLKCNFELATYTSCDTVMKKIYENPYVYDIVLLDYDDFQKTMEITKLIRRQNMICSLLIIGNTKNILLNNQILRYRPSGLFDKNIEFHFLQQAIIFEYNLHCKQNQFFCINSREKIIRLPFEKIEFFVSCQKYINTFTTDQRSYMFLSKLDEVENKVLHNNFIRCHQSYIVNLQNVLELDRINHQFRMLSGHMVEISRSHYKRTLDIYSNYTDQV